MTHLLQDVRSKLGRADEHLETVRDAVKRVTDRGSDSIPGQFDHDRGHHVFDVPHARLDEQFPLIVGDCIHDLRATLDYLACALVRTTGKQETDHTEFPIFVERAMKSAERQSKIGGIPPTAQAIIEQLQPFDGGPTLDPWDNPLALLYVLSKRDKHRRLNVTVKRASVDFVDVDGLPIDQPPPRISEWVMIGEGNAQATLSGLNPDVDVYARIGFDVVFYEEGPLLGKGVVQTLEQIRDHIWSLVPRFVPYFEHA
jgi:hypothetical protein